MKIHTKMELETAKIGERGQVTIPIKIRKELGIKKGDTMIFIKKGRGVFMKPTKLIGSLNELEEEMKDLF